MLGSIITFVSVNTSTLFEVGGSLSASPLFMGILTLATFMFAGIFSNTLLRKEKKESSAPNDVPASSHSTSQSTQFKVGLERTFIDKKQLEIPEEEYKFLSHDLRSPVKRINSLIDMLITHPDEDSRFEYVSHIQTEVNGLQELLVNFDQLLNSQTRLDMEVSKFNIYAFISPIYSGYQKIGQDKNINIAMDICPSHIVVETQRMVLYRIVDNLISNAMKFTKPGGVINVTIRTAGDDLVLAVSDEGPGIPKEEMGHIFEKFQVGTARPTGDETSSGIGLYLVKTLSDKLKAKIDIENKKKKGGAIFTMTIPNIVRKF